MMVDKNVTALIIRLVLITIIIGSIVLSGCDSALYSDNNEEPTFEVARDVVEAEGYSIYEYASEALVDIDTQDMIEAVEDEGYKVYSEPSEALEDIDDYEIKEKCEEFNY